ncbi:SOS response-associated peptidase family protein [Edaphobacter aggregans]|uniref:SOS response-associated peptidase family protein n=1 Tax=Edaphobacter aggregans TaxID=570835 RepID=UPI00068A686E|nr:SOS response-associated peptidase family protein [Edaphobacter aggregans]
MAAELHHLTTDANELMAAVHHRMPVILHPGDFDRWLDRDFDPTRPPIDLLRAPSPPTRWRPSRSRKT